MVLRNLEKRLEQVVEGVFARAFRSGLQPVEISRRLERQLDAERTLDPHGRQVGPNSFTVQMAPDDFARFAQITESLQLELVTAIREHAIERGIRFRGRVGVQLAADDRFATGRFHVVSAFVDGNPPGSSPAYLDLHDGRRIPLNGLATLGRLPESTIVLDDPNSSRHHAEIRPLGDTFELVDLGSTNGSRVNGVRVDRCELSEGDVLTFGAISMVFRLL